MLVLSVGCRVAIPYVDVDRLIALMLYSFVCCWWSSLMIVVGACCCCLFLVVDVRVALLQAGVRRLMLWTLCLFVGVAVCLLLLLFVCTFCGLSNHTNPINDRKTLRDEHQLNL